MPGDASPKVPQRRQSIYSKTEFGRAELNCLPGINEETLIPFLQSHIKGFLILLAAEKPSLSPSPPVTDSHVSPCQGRVCLTSASPSN